ncbi:MAG: hypothetical protein AAGH88_06135 [Planctomycetota bacterium]
MIQINVQHQLTHAPTPTPRTLAVASLFGLTLEPYSAELIPPTTLTLAPGRVVFITGTSGGGKSTFLRRIAEALEDRSDASVLLLDADEPLPDTALVDGFDHAPSDALDWSQPGPHDLAGPLRWLGLAGLSDARLMLRQPHQLSEGQRHRYRLARLIEAVDRCADAQEPDHAELVVVLADEFLTPLDRVTAAAVAGTTARWARRAGVCLVAATAHDDLLEPLGPDVLVDATPQGIQVSCQ